MAAKQLLRTRSLPKTKIFWSDEFKAKIYLLDHPSFFVRGGRGVRFDAWRQLLKQIAKDREILVGADSESLSDPYHFIKQQNYVAVCDEPRAKRASKQRSTKQAKKGRRVSS